MKVIQLYKGVGLYSAEDFERQSERMKGMYLCSRQVTVNQGLERYISFQGYIGIEIIRKELKDRK